MKVAQRSTRLKVALLGEAPNDTIAIGRLLEKQFGERIQCFSLLDRITGSGLDDIRTDKALRLEYELARPHIVVVIRDLDGREHDTAQLRYRRTYFRRINRIVEQRGIYLLNIYSIEALLLADADVVNERYGCRCIVEVDPAHIENPSEVLAHVTGGQYAEGHCRELFPLLRYNRLTEICGYFAQFHHAFTARLAEPRLARR